MPTLDPRIADAPEPADGLSAQGRAQRAKVDVARVIGYLDPAPYLAYYKGPMVLDDKQRRTILGWLRDADEMLDPLAYPRLSAIEGGKR